MNLAPMATRAGASPSLDILVHARPDEPFREKLLCGSNPRVDESMKSLEHSSTHQGRHKRAVKKIQHITKNGAIPSSEGNIRKLETSDSFVAGTANPFSLHRHSTKVDSL
ncbi:unnamed protein product [Dibothriocephalus latus]|uniref:Uncharacterized protein n=1 Tax=Dibothriocephalus latus TaxID=60516 RepID=A0A3P6QMB4_DIBLA|nr:unnamed protein product [Dibothriocephalus latus]